MNKKELLDLLSDYSPFDEVVVLSPGGRESGITGMDYNELTLTGRIALTTEWKVDTEKEEEKARKAQVKLKEANRANRQDYVMRSDHTLEMARHKYPWVKGVRLMGQVYILFESEEDYNSKKIRIHVPEHLLKRNTDDNTDTGNRKKR